MVNKDYWVGKKILVAGAGKSGLSAARLLSHHGAHVEIVDDVQEPYKKLSTSSVDNNDIIILSPGIPRSHPAIAHAIAGEKAIYNEIDVGVTFLPQCTWVGITGTNGKSTTTAMVGAIAQQAHAALFVGGNLGTPLCDAVMHGLQPTLGILELSSFQLETLSLLSLDVAVITNLAPDHLDHYASVEDYYAAKKKIVGLLKEDGVFIRGDNVSQNRDTSTLIAQALGISSEHIAAGLQNYQPLAHRMEHVGTLRGIAWINDSKGTNVHATCYSVRNFDHGIHLIVGGIVKENDFSSLIESCTERVKTIYTIGKDGVLIGKALKHVAPVIDCETLEKATMLAMQHACEGDTLLLSPACSSYDQFKDFTHRGDVFKKLFHQYQSHEQQQ